MVRRLLAAPIVVATAQAGAQASVELAGDAPFSRVELDDALRPTPPADGAAGPGRAGEAGVAGSELSGEQRLREARAVAEVYAALDRIKPAKRVALLLHVVEGLGFAEVGAIVGASEETAKKRAQAAQREVRAALGRRGERTP
jgi:DNA-directed RNA polymerase specialized sigma24 family protein